MSCVCASLGKLYVFYLKLFADYKNTSEYCERHAPVVSDRHNKLACVCNPCRITSHGNKVNPLRQLGCQIYTLTHRTAMKINEACQCSLSAIISTALDA